MARSAALVVKLALAEGRSAAVLGFLRKGTPAESSDYEFFISSTGNKGWVKGVYSPNYDTHGKIIGVIGIIQDVTERKRAEDALRQVHMKFNLLSSITGHDINNQLTALQGCLTLLEDTQPDPRLSGYAGKASAAAQRISSLIQFTKGSDSIGITTPVWQNSRSLADIAAQQVPLGHVAVKNDLPAGAEVFAGSLIVKVFYNLMDNAVRYGGKITTIRFSAEESGDTSVIICEDDGKGIPVEEKEQIFDKGFGNNSGLGLYLSREILSITGITIRETGEPGKGARFEMVVPKGAWRVAGSV